MTHAPAWRKPLVHLARMLLLCIASGLAATAMASDMAAQTSADVPATSVAASAGTPQAEANDADSNDQGEAPGLADCPGTPNCVSSLASDPERRVEPLLAGTDATSAQLRLAAVLDSLPRVSWQATSAHRIDAEFTSRLLRFVDDVNFVIRDDGMVEVRSASRIGYSDLGANRKRVTMLREALQQHASDAIDSSD